MRGLDLHTVYLYIWLEWYRLHYRNLSKFKLQIQIQSQLSMSSEVLAQLYPSVVKIKKYQKWSQLFLVSNVVMSGN